MPVHEPGATSKSATYWKLHDDLVHGFERILAKQEKRCKNLTPVQRQAYLKNMVQKNASCARIYEEFQRIEREHEKMDALVKRVKVLFE